LVPGMEGIEESDIEKILDILRSNKKIEI